MRPGHGLHGQSVSLGCRKPRQRALCHHAPRRTTLNHFHFLLQIMPMAYILQPQSFLYSFRICLEKSMVFSAIEENVLKVHRWSFSEPASSWIFGIKVFANKFTWRLFYLENMKMKVWILSLLTILWVVISAENSLQVFLAHNSWLNVHIWTNATFNYVSLADTELMFCPGKDMFPLKASSPNHTACSSLHITIPCHATFQGK